MRVLLDISDAQARALDDLAEKEGRSRDVLVREAIIDFLAKPPSIPGDEAFGSWGKVDGLAYQRRLRREW